MDISVQTHLVKTPMAAMTASSLLLRMILQAWHTFFLEASPIVLGIIVKAQPGWAGSIGERPFSGLCSQSFPEATTVFSWRCASGRCIVEMFTFA